MFMENFLLLVSGDILTIGRIQIDIWWWPFVFALIKNFLMILTVLLVVATFLVFYRFKSLRTKFYDAVGEAIESGKLSKEKIVERWDEVRSKIDSDSVEDNRKAVMSAEEIFEGFLKSSGYTGENTEKIIEKIPESRLSFKEDILWAYQTKVQLSQGDDTGIGKDEMERVVYIFERALRELNIL